ncbi:glycine-rich domain-containing protein [Massilia brevitalea]|uniref:glycine-rich domain-containing protein n=1 Tax=Massilia brevitalea TaxID=442526 RepID=UPI0027391820|nr:glycine-rich domain-containing protein-like [Massilia brevitalea]
MISNNDFAAIAALDLSPIKVKLMHKESGEGWSLDKANAMETEYRRFLYLMKTFPNDETAPQVDVDTFWHYHILDTMKYAQDCEQAFGYFLHHYPYIGLRSEDDVAVQQQAGERMRELYESTFGEAYFSFDAEAQADLAWCGRAPANVVDAAAEAAWCGRAPAVSADGAAQTAWCGRAPAGSDGAMAKTAWCGRAPIKPLADAVQTAWCGRAPAKAEATAKDSAWCGRAPAKAEAAAKASAWCGRAPAKTAATAQDTAWCGRAPAGAEAAAVQTAWCGRAPVAA